MKSTRSLLDFALVATPKFAGGLCLMSLNIALMRWVGPDDYGVYSLCIASLSLLSEGLFGAAIDMGVIRFAPLHLELEPERAIEIERSALRLKLLIVAIVSSGLMLLSHPLSRLAFHQDGQWHLIGITCVAALGSLTLSSALLHYQIRGRFLRYGMLDTLHILVKFGSVTLVILYAESTQQPLSISYVIGCFAAGPFVACLWFVATNQRQWKLPRRMSLDPNHSELLQFIKWFFLTLLVSSLVSRIDVFTLSGLSSIEDVGLYAAGQTIASIPLLLGYYLSVVLSPKVMPMYAAGTLRSLLIRVQSLLFCVAVCSFLLFYFVRSTVVEPTLPASFAASADVIYLLLPSTLAGMTSFPLVVPLLMFVRPRFLVMMELVMLPVQLASYFIVIPVYGATGAAVCTTLFGIVKTAIAQREAFRCAQHASTNVPLSAFAIDNSTDAV
jgi:O-antigen/teichoic acid export membrane protein